MPDDEPDTAPLPTVGGGAGRRLRGAVWGVPASMLMLWIAGVARYAISDGYTADSGALVGRSVGALSGRLFLVTAATAIVAALILGRLGVWLSAAVAAIAGYNPAILPDWAAERSFRWTPDWLVRALADAGALPGDYLRWVAFLAVPILALYCLGRALRSN